MASDSSPDRAVNRPLWVIAFSLAVIAVCLLLLVVQVQLREEPRNLAKPPSSAEEMAANTKPAQQPKPPRWFAPKTVVGDQASATPVGEQGASAGETLAAPSEPPAPALSKTAQSSGGYAPLSYLGQTNYQNAIIGKVVLHGTPPPEKRIDFEGKTPCAGPDSGPLTTRFFVVGPTGELADTLVSLRNASDQPTTSTPHAPHELVFTNCMIEPYVSAILTGDEIVARTSDRNVFHVLQPETAGSPSFLESIKPGATSKPHRLSQPELFVRFSCRVHPWEFAYVSVLPHPFFAITDKSGAFAITNVPPGEYVLEAIHRKAQT